jgi:hypothetical protein
LTGGKKKKFLVCRRDRAAEEDIALGVLEERRRFNRGDNVIGMLKLARIKFAIREQDLGKIYVLKIS